MTYKELSEDLIELMNNKTPISLKSLINTICECKDVERIINIPYEAIEGTRIAEASYRNTTEKREYLNGFINTSDKKRVYCLTYISIVLEKGYGSIYYSRCDLPSPNYNSNAEIIEVDFEKDIIYIVGVNDKIISSEVLFGK